MRKQKKTSESSVISGKKGYILLPEALPARTLFLITLLSLMLYPQKLLSQNICVYPFENTSDNPTLNWIGPYISYHIFRNIKAATGESIWSPAFLYDKDKLISSNPDSLKNHQERWNWTFMIKGKYRTLQDSIVFKTEIYSFSKKGLREKTFITSCHTDSYIKGIDNLFRHTLSIISENSNNSGKPTQPEIKNTEAVSVFGSGLYFEFNNKADKAISSYTFALDMEPDFSWAHLKIGELYSKSNKLEKADYHLSKAAKLNRSDPIPVSAYAIFLLNSGKRGKSLDYISKHRPTLTTSSEGLKTVALSMAAQGNYQRAIAMLTQARSMGSSDLSIRFHLGKIYMQTGDFTSAINTFSSLIEYLPDETSYYLSLGKAYRSADKLMESVHVLENALKRDSLNIKTLLNLSHTYAMLDWDKKALQLLLKAREEAPYFEEIDLNLSVLYWKTGEKEKAAKILRNLNSKKTRLRKKVLNNLGNILLASGETRDAIKMYMDAEKLGGKDEEIYYNLALAYLERGKYGKAVDILKQLLRLSPERNDIILKTAELSAMTGDTANAKLMYHKLLKRSPYNKDVIRNLSELYIDMEEYEEAVEVLESYLKAYPQDNEFKLWLPEIYYTMGWYEVALTKYEEIMKEEIYHNSPKVHLGIGKNLAAKVLNNQSADVEKAFKYLKKAAALNPSDPTPLYHLGLLYRNVRGDKEKARKAWKKALGLSVGDSGDRGNSMYRKLKKLLREID